MDLNSRLRVDDVIYGLLVVTAFLFAIGLDAAVFRGAILGRDAQLSDARRLEAQKKTGATVASVPKKTGRAPA